jgi:hypothetical protein
MAGCKFSSCTGDEKKIDAAAAAFHTPADVRVHEAMREAIWQGGITKDDFPKTVRSNVFMWSGMPFGEPAACVAARSAENRR